MAPSVRTAPAAGAVLVRRNNSNSNGFYNNLFYILIAVLGAFVVVAVINFMRNRRRRRIVFAEADRLGLMVPGMPGYVPMRERPALVKADGWRTPDWWEVVDDRKLEPTSAQSLQPESAQRGASAPPASSDADTYGARGDLEVGDMNKLRPLALIPKPIEVYEPPKPLSPLKFFPNYVSYPKSAHIPKPPRFPEHDPDAYSSIVGEPLEVHVAVRMPRPPLRARRPSAAGEDDDDAVMDEWGGIEIGVANWTVAE